MSKLTEKAIRKLTPKRDKPKQYVSPDGRARDPKTEHRINEAFSIVFKGAAGEVVREYLKSISTNRVIGPGAEPTAYCYHEGARWLMGVIDTRIKDGEEKKP